MGTVRLILMGGAYLVLTGCAGTGKVPDGDDFPDRPKVRFASREVQGLQARIVSPIHLVGLEVESGEAEGRVPGDAWR